LASIVAGASSCSSLPDIDLGVCGNGVVEPDHNEDCDNGITDDAGNSLCYPAGTVGQCHFDCSVVDCPTGFSCGNDAICRKPSGIFKDTGHATQIDADRLLAGDFDHDRLGDVVAQTAVQMDVLFGDSTGALSEPFTVRSTNARPTVGLLALDPDGGTSEPYTDLVFTASGGITTWRGRQDRTLAPTPYPSLQIGNGESRVIEARTTTPNDDVLVLTPLSQFRPGQTGSVLGEINSNEAPNTSATFAVFPGDDGLPQHLVGNVIVADFNVLPSSPCEEIALAFDTPSLNTFVTVVTTCSDPSTLNIFSPDGGAPLIAPVTVKLPPGATIRAGGTGATSGDINGDGKTDLLIDAMAPIADEAGIHVGEATLVAFSIGDGTFTGDGTLATLNEFNGAQHLADDADVLAAGQLTIPNDFVPDLVTTKGIVLGVAGAGADAGAEAGTSSGMPVAIAAPNTWVDARIADIDGDHFLDVVAGSAGEVDIYRASGNAIIDPTAVHYAVDGTASQFAIGDFDGDRVPDVAFRADHGDGTADLDVMWGHFLGVPDDPEIVGRFGNIRTIGTGVITGTIGGNDSLSDLGVVVEAPPVVGADAGPFSVSVLAGTTNRQLQAPFLVQQNDAGLQNIGDPISYSIGQLTVGDRHADVVSSTAFQRSLDAGSDGGSGAADIKLAIAQSVGAAQLSSDPSQLKFSDKFDSFALSTNCTGSDCNPAAADWTHLLLVTADLDGLESDGGVAGNGVDEIIGIAPAVGTGVQTHDEAVVGQLLFGRFDGSRWNVQSTGLGVVPRTPTANPKIFTWGTPIASIAAADVNGDGNTDVLTLISGPQQTSLLAYINESTGQLPTRSTVIPLPAYSLDGATFQIVSIAAIDADGDPGKEVAMLTDKGGLFLAKSNAAGDSFTVTGPLCDGAGLQVCANNASQRIVSGQAIAATDVDGDGIQDLVIESNLTLRVYKGLAVDP
jgi:hypothetical protein